MSKKTKIQWAEHTGGPFLGCSKVSPGCTHCYAAELAETRLEPIFRKAYKAAGFEDAETRPIWGDKATRVLSKGFWSNARRINAQHAKDGTRGRWFPSMIDWLDTMPAGIIDQEGKKLDSTEVRTDLLKLLHDCSHLDFLMLSKRIENFFPLLEAAWKSQIGQTQAFLDWLRKWGMDGKPPANVWLGVSVEDQQRADERIPALLKIPATVRFLSVEPLLSSLDLSQYLHERQRSIVFSVGSNRTILSGLAGENMEALKNERRQQTGRSVSLSPDGEAEGGNQFVGKERLPKSDVQPQSHSEGGLCSPDSLDGSQQVGHPGSVGSEPHRRQQKEQSPNKYRTSNPVEERRALLPSPGKKTKRPVGGKELVQQVEGEPGYGDSGHEGQNQPVSNLENVQCEPKDSFRDPATQDLEAPLISWVIVGGESGKGARPCNVEWIRSIVKQCQAAGVPCFVKQLGAKPQHRVGSDLDAWTDDLKLKDPKGGDPSEWSEDLRVRQFPQ